MVLAFGTGMKLNPKTELAIDGMFTKYSGVAGFGSPGGIVDRVVQPFGWRNVWTFKTGIKRDVSDKLNVRAGYNYSQMPVRARRSSPRPARRRPSSITSPAASG